VLGIGYFSARAKFLQRQPAASADRWVRGTRPAAHPGPGIFWDSNGGSFSRGMSMGARGQQWPWFAILAKSGREKSASLLLENGGYACFVPTSKYARHWSDRIKQVEVPLFPGYFFCRMNPMNRLPVLMTPGVIQIVGVGKTPIPVEEEEIAAIQRVGKSGLATMPWPYIEVGNVARIEEGPLRGLTGIVVKIKSGMKLVLSVTLLQRSVAVEIERKWVSNLGGEVRVSSTEGQPAASAAFRLNQVKTEIGKVLLGKLAEAD
jgi:transcription antitermination factor NusG